MHSVMKCMNVPSSTWNDLYIYIRPETIHLNAILGIYGVLSFF